MNPLISIIIPVYNVAPYLAQCLDSVVNQTYSNLQIICVDDGSTDASPQVLDKYAALDSRIKVIHKENAGVSFARNTALKEVSGEYILFVDGDDWIKPETCAVALDALQKSEADVVMWSYVREMHDESRKKNIYDSDVFFDGQAVRHQLYRRMVGVYGKETSKPENADALCTVWGKLYRSDLIKENGLLFHDIRDIGTYEDGLFNLNVFSKVSRAVFVNKHLYHYRRDNESSLTTSYNALMPEKWNKLFDILYEHIESNDLDESFRTALNNRIVFSLIALGINETEKHDGMIKTVKRIFDLLMSSRYRDAIEDFNFQYLPIHWKLFFMCAKHKLAVGVYLLLLVIQKIRGR